MEHVEQGTGFPFQVETGNPSPVPLPQVRSADLPYGANNKPVDGADAAGALSASATKPVRCSTWQESDAAEVLKGVNAVVFPVTRT